MRLEVGEQRVELRRRHLAIAVPPQHIAREFVFDGVFVLWRAAGVVAGLGAERAALDQLGFAG